MFKLLPQFIVIASILVIIIVFLRRLPQVTIREEEVDLSGLKDSSFKERAASLYRKLWEFLKRFFKTAGTYIVEAKDYTSKTGYLERFSRVLRLKQLKSQFSNLRGRHGGSLSSKAANYLEDNNVEQAEKIFIKIIEQDHTNREAYEGLGKIYLEQKKFKEAREVYEFLIKHHPNNDSYFSSLGLANFNLSSFDKAIEAYKKAIELRPDGVNRMINLSLCYEAKGQLPEAIEALEQALTIAPDNPQYLLLLADFLVKDGKKKVAEEILEKILELEPTNHIAREKLMTLKF